MPPAAATAEPTAHAPHSWQEPWGAFANWAAEHLNLALEFSGNSYHLTDRADLQAEAKSSPGRSGFGSSLLSLGKSRAKPGEPEPVSYASPGELAAALLARAALQDNPPDLAPMNQPERVHDMAHRLLDAYQVDDGGLHLAGCSFEDVPFVRVTELATEGGEPAFVHSLYDQHGSAVDNQTAEQLGLTTTHDLDHRPPTPYSLPVPLSASGAPAAVSAIVWAKRVSGNLRFAIGEQEFTAPFEGWSRTLTAPPVACPQTGEPTFHLTALSDGAIVAAEQVGRCEASGQRLLHRDLVTCSVTGKQVAVDLCETCPVSGDPALKEEFVTCDRCGERVSRVVATHDRCSACRSMRRTTPGDPTLAAILAAHPALSTLKRWRLSETRQAYLLQGGRLLARYFFVLDRINLSVTRAMRLGPLGQLVELSDAERASLLGR